MNNLTERDFAIARASLPQVSTATVRIRVLDVSRGRVFMRVAQSPSSSSPTGQALSYPILSRSLLGGDSHMICRKWFVWSWSVRLAYAG